MSDKKYLERDGKLLSRQAVRSWKHLKVGDDVEVNWVDGAVKPGKVVAKIRGGVEVRLSSGGWVPCEHLQSLHVLREVERDSV